MLRKIRADLHIHTCLSPCGDQGMVPSAIVNKAISEGLDLIGICDHNSSENAAAVKKAGEIAGLKVISGMEVTSREEVHILALFDEEEKLSEFQKIIYDNLEGENDSDLFGYQIITDVNDEITGINDKLLIGATGLSLDQVVDLIHSFNGLAIASHVDRERFGLTGQLGFVPKDLKLDALELSPAYMQESKKFDFGMSSGLPLVTFSDAHYIDDIGKTSTVFVIEEITVPEIKKALENADGRSVAAYS